MYKVQIKDGQTPCASPTCMLPPEYLQTSANQTWLQNLQPVPIINTPTPQPPGHNRFQCYEVVRDRISKYVIISESGELLEPSHETTKTLSPTCLPTTFDGSASDLAGWKMPTSTSSLPQGVADAHSSSKPVEEVLQKRELRLMKNREAARECRRKKKEYVKCLENRVAVLENQNKTLIEELRALKDVYRVKVE